MQFKRMFPFCPVFQTNGNLGLLFFPCKTLRPTQDLKGKATQITSVRIEMQDDWIKVTYRAPAKRIEIETNQVLKIASEQIFMFLEGGPIVSHTLPGFSDDFPMSRHPKPRRLPSPRTLTHQRRCGAGFVAAVHLGRGLHAQSGKCQERPIPMTLGVVEP